MVLIIEVLFLFVLAVVLSTITRWKKKRGVDKSLDAWAEDLGMVRIGDELVGQMRGIPVGARLAFDSPHGTQINARWTLYARLQPPLDLGLLACNRMIPVDMPGVGHQEAYSLERTFDGRFKVLSDERHRAIALLSPPVRHAMLKLLHRQALFMVTDAGVAVQAVEGIDLATLRTGLNAVSEIADELNSARDRVQVAAALQSHQPMWTRFAAHNGLKSIAAPLCMFGTIEDATVYAYAVRLQPHDFQLEVWMRFEQPLALGLLVQPMRTIDRMKDMFGVEDYKLGDELFDETFLVRVSDAAGTVSLLDEETRGRLLVIHDTVGPLSLTDDGVSIRLPMVPRDPAVVPRLVRQLIDIASFISEKRQRDRHGGPYR